MTWVTLLTLQIRHTLSNLTFCCLFSLISRTVLRLEHTEVYQPGGRTFSFCFRTVFYDVEMYSFKFRKIIKLYQKSCLLSVLKHYFSLFYFQEGTDVWTSFPAQLPAKPNQYYEPYSYAIDTSFKFVLSLLYYV